MYAQFSNQLIHLLHYFFAFAFLMIILPKVIFKNRHQGDPLEQIVVNYLKMVFFTIIVGYVLILTKLFEVLSLLAIWSSLIWYKYLSYKSGRNRQEVFTSINTWFYDYLDGLFRIGRLLLQNLKTTLLFWKHSITTRFSNFQVISELLVLAFVFISAAYYRFYDALVHAAPAMSDAYVTLAWIKYNSSRKFEDFFHDGIYPQGFHINMALLHKFAAIDELYILKYTGPLISMFTMLGFYFVVSRFTGRKIPGIVSALVYGLCGHLISESAWIRQASTNSQEFAFVFILPTLYFFYQYLHNGKKENFWAGATGLAITGLVHSFAQGFAGLGLLALIAAAILLNTRKYIRQSIEISIAGAASLAIAAFPLGMGFLLGKSLNDSSSAFLTSTLKTPITIPILHGMDYVALVSLAILVFFFGISLKTRKESLLLLFSIFFIAGTFFINEFGGKITNSTLITSRAGDLWALAVPYCIGMGVYVLFKLFTKLRKRETLELACTVILIVLIMVFIRPTAIQPYKMESDHSVEQYLRIAGSYPAKMWMVVSQKEGYDLVFSNGYHLLMKDFLPKYDPTKPPLTIVGENAPDAKIPLDTYIYREKNIFEVSKDNVIYSTEKLVYEERARQMIQLGQWVDSYKNAGNTIEIFFEDNDLIIYHIHREQTKEEKNAKIWGNHSKDK
jgi:hypothetical protein